MDTKCDLLVAGASLGGVSAALAAADQGLSVILTEECKWIGGQLTSQGVSAPDEHPWVEYYGVTRSYRRLRNGIRDYYRRNFPLSAENYQNPYLNPGNGWVSQLCHDPRVALAVLQEMLAPHLASGKIQLYTQYLPTDVHSQGDRIAGVTFRSLEGQQELIVEASFVIDATETGDLLPLGNVEYVTGAESVEDTKEPHARDSEARPDDVQSFTVCFFLDTAGDENTLVPKPASYEKHYSLQPLRWEQIHPITGEPRPFILWDAPGWYGPALWTYRRILDANQFQAGAYPSDITLVNWPQNDYRANFLDKTEAEKQSIIQEGKNLSLSLLWWIQNEAPRPDGKTGFPELRLRPDITGTEDGMAQYPYVRESRRINSLFRILEQHIALDCRPDGMAEVYSDSVGIGLYRIDLHPSVQNPKSIDLSCCPFQIPLGALLPQRVENLIAGCKNIGTTHITNGAYRLHPVEWNIGESAGMLAAFCKDKNTSPQAVWQTSALLADYQATLRRRGIPLEWPRPHPV